MGLFDDIFKKKGVSRKNKFPKGKEFEINPDALVYFREALTSIN